MFWRHKDKKIKPGKVRSEYKPSMLTICETSKLKKRKNSKLNDLNFYRVNRGADPEAEMAPRNEDMVEVKLIFIFIKPNSRNVKKMINKSEIH